MRPQAWYQAVTLLITAKNRSMTENLGKKLTIKFQKYLQRLREAELAIKREAAELRALEVSFGNTTISNVRLMLRADGVVDNWQRAWLERLTQVWYIKKYI